MTTMQTPDDDPTPRSRPRNEARTTTPLDFGEGREGSVRLGGPGPGPSSFGTPAGAPTLRFVVDVSQDDATWSVQPPATAPLAG
jgi:hypothetical protein